MKAFRAVSLFSGAGGLDVGVASTGRFDLLACVELKASCCDTLRANHAAGHLGAAHTKIIQADLSLYDPYVLMQELGLRPGELDLLVGGPPCQSFSTAGRRRTVADSRGTLVWDFLRFVEALRPRYFLMENVRGLLSAALRHRPIAARPAKGGPPLSADEQPGSVIRLWAQDLAKISNGAYRVDCFEVNAVNYGAPQLRERVLLIGNREGRLVDFPAPTHGQRPAWAPHRTLRDALGGFIETDPVCMDFSPRKKAYLAMVPPGGNWRTLPAEMAQESMGRAFHAKGGRSGWWRRLSWDLPCPTVVTLPNHASTSMCHPEDVRALTVGEFAQIQEFPAGWVFTGSPAEQMAQVGNAVPVRLGTVAANTIAGYLDQPLARTPEPAPAFRRVYLNSHVRTRQWYKAGQVFVWDGIGGSAHYGSAPDGPTPDGPAPDGPTPNA
jgi:DNA (cytosine-5)-methyltransferase 1